MPIVQADRLKKIGADLLRAAGASKDEAEAVAAGCINANLAGHDSHGIIAIPTYIDRIKVGHIVPGEKWTIVQESPTTTVIDGHWGFGFYVNAKALELTIEKARVSNIAACTVFRQSHVGRLGAGLLEARFPKHGDRQAEHVLLQTFAGQDETVIEQADQLRWQDLRKRSLNVAVGPRGH